jgi:hypothetical protein
MYNNNMSKETNVEYRVLSDIGNSIYCIHVVHLNDQGIPVSYDPTPVNLTSTSVESLSHVTIHAISAFTKPVLEYSYFKATSETHKQAMELLRRK